MKGKRLGAFFAALIGLTAFVGTAAAQPSVTDALIDQLNGKLLYIAVPITILVEAILIYTVVKFKDADEAKPTRENRRLEITWTVATAIILLFVGVASYGVLANPNVVYTPAMDDPEPSAGDVVVNATSYQWNWRMNYPNHNLTGVTASQANLSAADELTTEETENLQGPTLVLPEDQDIYIDVYSEDVIHAFHVPELGLKQDAVPGVTDTIKTRMLEPGVYQGYCAEYCGSGHSRMYFNVVVVSQDTYDQFIEANAGAADAPETGNGTSAPTGTAVPNGTAAPVGTGTGTASASVSAPLAA